MSSGPDRFIEGKIFKSIIKKFFDDQPLLDWESFIAYYFIESSRFSPFLINRL